MELQNFFISKVTPDLTQVVRWDPDNPQPVPISVEVTGCQKAFCDVAVYTEDITGGYMNYFGGPYGVWSPYWTQEQDHVTIGGSQSSRRFDFVWDGMQRFSDGTAIPYPKGIYKIYAGVNSDTPHSTAISGGDSWDSSPTTMIGLAPASQTFGGVNGPSLYAECVSDDGAQSVYKIRYSIASVESHPASAGVLEVYNDDLQAVQSQALQTQDLTAGDHAVSITVADSIVTGRSEFLVHVQDSDSALDKAGRVSKDMTGQFALPLALNYDCINFPQYKVLPPMTVQPPPKTAPYANPNLPVVMLKDAMGNDTDHADPAQFNYSGVKWQKYAKAYQIEPGNAANHTNLTAKQAMDQVLKVKPEILSLFSHGGPGEDGQFPAMTFWNGTTEDPISDASKDHDWWNDDNRFNKWSYWVGAQKNLDEAIAGNPKLDPSQIVVIKNLGTGVADTKVLKFLDYACFIGCNTATQVFQVGKESPAQAAVEKGAYIASGFRDTITSHVLDASGKVVTPATEEWAARFWYFLLVRRHTVKDAWQAALDGFDKDKYSIDNYGTINAGVTNLGLFRVFHSDKVDKNPDFAAGILIPRKQDR